MINAVEALTQRACQYQEDASYYAWYAVRCRNIGDDIGAMFFQQESAWFAESARLILGITE